MTTELVCFNSKCRSRYPIEETIYQCPKCNALLEVENNFRISDPEVLRSLWNERLKSREALDVSGVWRFREMLPFIKNHSHIITLQEGNTPLLNAPRAATYGGLKSLQFKHQGYNPSASFKDNGMTAGVAQARKLGMKRVACVSTGNTSASMAAYAAAAQMQAIILVPHGSIAYGKLAQALEYGAFTLQVEANFDQILSLVRRLVQEIGLYLLNSVNPFRIEGQKTIAIEMLDQREWKVPDWIVLPGGNLGNVSAFGKSLREMKQVKLIDRIPRLAVVQAERAAPFYDLFQRDDRGKIRDIENPETLATAIRIGAPVSWPKALFEVEASDGLVECVTDQQIADAKAVIGRCGIGCEPASAATLAGIRKLTAEGKISPEDDVVAILTGHLLKDPDYIYRYHTGKLKIPDGQNIKSTFGNGPLVVPNDAKKIAKILEKSTKSPVETSDGNDF